jgi:hypothetical protein
MNSISACIDSLIAIDDQVFLAECDVMLANDIWLNKMSDMIKYSGNSDSMIGYIQEADYGRRDTGGNQWLSKLRVFILKCIDKIVDAVTNFLLKIKTRKADYIRIPYKYEDLMEDINLVKSIDKEIYQIFDNVENFASADNVKKLMAIKEKLRNTHFAKNQRFIISNKDPEAHNKLNKYGIKPDQYMKLAKELRDLNRALKDTKIRASKMVQKEWLKDPNSIDKPRVVVQELLFNIYTEMSKMMVKLMQSFTVSGVEKMDQAVIEKKIKAVKLGIIQLQKIIDESVEYDIDDDELEFFDETEKPFDDYLKKHNYDPNKNTIEFDGERHNAGKIPSKKERNRMNRFLRENNYDPKTETYESDIIGKNGKPERIKLNITPNTDDYYNSHNKTYYRGELTDESIDLTQKTIKKKPNKSNQSLKHEEGHANQLRGRDSGHIKDAEKMITQNPLDKDTQNDHYKPKELDADVYGYQHNRYANKDKSNKTGLEVRYKDDVSSKSFDNEIKHKKERYENDKDFHIKTIKDEAVERAINNLTSDIGRRKRKISSILSDIEELTELYSKENDQAKRDELKSDLDLCNRLKERTTKILGELESKLSRVKNGDYDLKADEKMDYNTIKEDIDMEIARYLNDITEDINKLERLKADVKQEEIFRNKFLDQHAEIGGSKARKLEGRQGKHKGKK